MPLGTLQLNPFARASAVNRILSETRSSFTSSRVWALAEGPFHAGTVEIGRLIGTTMTTLKYGVDFEYGFLWADASSKLGTKVYGAIVLSDAIRAAGGTLYISYNAVGGSSLAGLNFSILKSNTAPVALANTLESRLTMPTFPTVANIWKDTTLTDLAVAKASLSTLGLDIEVKARST